MSVIVFRMSGEVGRTTETMAKANRGDRGGWIDVEYRSFELEKDERRGEKRVPVEDGE